MTDLHRRVGNFSECVNFLRTLLPFLVILVHVPFLYTEDVLWNKGVECTIWIFTSSLFCQLAVPSFFFISGYYFFSKFNLEKWDWRLFFSKIKKRFKTLLLPYILWNLIYIIPQVLSFIIGIIDIKILKSNLSWHYFWDYYSFPKENIFGMTRLVEYPLDAPLWFIRDLFVMCLMAPIIFYLLRHLKSIIIIVGMVFYVLDIYIPITGFSKSIFCFIAGSYFMLNKIEPLEIFEKGIFLQIVLSFIFAVLGLFLWGNYPLEFSIVKRLYRICTIPILFISISWLLDKGKIKTHRRLESYGFFIFAAHFFIVQSVLVPAFKHFLPGMITFSPLLVYFLIAILTYMLSVVAKWLIDFITPKVGYYLNGCR